MNTDRLTVYVSNDNLIEVDGLQNAASDAYITSVTSATFTLVDSSGNDVTGAVDIALSYVSGSNGKWRGTLADTVSLTAAAKYTCNISINAGAGLQGEWSVPVRAETRKE